MGHFRLNPLSSAQEIQYPFLYKHIFVCLNIDKTFKVFVIWKENLKHKKLIELIKINYHEPRNSAFMALFPQTKLPFVKRTGS